MNKESTLYKIVLLGVLCAICGALLSAVNNVTAPIIEQQAIAAEKENLEKIYPGANFTPVADFDDPTGYVLAVFEAEGKGMVYKIHATGYNSNGFTFMIAFNEDGTVGGFTAVEQSESPGIGAEAFNDPYVSEVMGLTADDQMPLITGATLTTTAIRNGVDAAEALFHAGK